MNQAVMILTGDAGFGHRRSASAIAGALAEISGGRCKVEILNPLHERSLIAPLRNTDRQHDLFARQLRGLYAAIWNGTRGRLPTALMARLLVVALRSTVGRLVRSHHPDAIITTFNSFNAPLAAVLAGEGLAVPAFTVVTDLGPVHPLWFARAAGSFLVATDELRRQAIACGVPATRVHLTGIPVDPELGRAGRNRAALRKHLGWRSDLPVVLAVGSRRVTRLAETVRALDGCGLPLQLAIVAGGDEQLFRRLSATPAGWRTPVCLYRWSEEMPAMMRAADCLISKAGGLITAEALACGLPLLFVEAMPDQERGNAAFVAEHGAGALVASPAQAVETLRGWLAGNGERLAELAARARALGRPQAAQQVAEIVWKEIAAR